MITFDASRSMKTSFLRRVKLSFLLLSLLLLFRLAGLAQGRVLINEFMAWSGCSTTSEYIELMNFGPGPANIGCYIVTNGQYSVTIPANTVLNQGEYFVLAGQNSLAMGCGNIDSTIEVDLNWNTCNCTNAPVPATGNGFMLNGGGANEKIVLLSPTLSIVDAVSRSVPVSASASITTATNGGTCAPHTFDLDLMPIQYEVINIATGVDNSYSRRVDGDCGWVKTTDISAGGPNKTGSSSSANYSFSTLSASECNGTTGSISIAVSASDVPALFPMTYTLAYDSDSNGVFNNNDTYVLGVDSSASSIDINNLAYGRYRITVGSSSGCNLQSYDFFIFNCYGVVLPYRVISLNYDGITDNRHSFTTVISGVQHLESITLQGKVNGKFVDLDKIAPNTQANTSKIPFTAPVGISEVYRVRLTGKDKEEYYSGEIKVGEPAGPARVWPNPATNSLNVQLPFAQSQVYYSVINNMGDIVLRNHQYVSVSNSMQIPIERLSAGNYRIILFTKQGTVLMCTPFNKK